MKRTLTAIALLALILLGSTACGTIPTDKSKSLIEEPNDVQKSPGTRSEDVIKETIEDRAYEALSLIKSKDMDKLAIMIHPDKGVRFSPYSYVNTSTDLVFRSTQMKDILSDKNKYSWGYYDGSGEPIELTFGDYYNKFIYDEDFINAKEIGYNKIIGKGNLINNSFEVYPGSIIVEYHFPGFDPQYSGIDWRSLKLVFEEKDNTWYIIGIIHDQWTI